MSMISCRNANNRKKETFSNVLREYCETCTAHGFSRLVSTQNIVLKILWSLAIIGVIAYCVFGISIFELIILKFNHRF